MKISLALAVAVAAALAALAGVAVAGPNANHKIAVHVVPHGVACKSLPTFSHCSEIVTTYPGIGDIDVIPVFYDLSEVAVIEFGLTWPAEWGTCEFTQCWGDLTFGDIVNSGDGICTTALSCDYSWAIRAGVGWLYASGPGTVAVNPNPPTKAMGAVDCAPPESVPSYDWPRCTSSASVGGGAGEDPCCEGGLNPLGIAVSDGLGGGCVYRGDQVTYTLTYDNLANPSEVRGVCLICYYEEWNGALEFVSATSGGVNRPEDSSVFWSLGSLAPGQTGSVQFTLRVLPPAANRVYVCGYLSGSGTPSSQASLHTHVCAQSIVPLDLAKSDGLGGGCAAPGGELTYTITYGNSRSVAVAHNVVLADRLPELAEFLSASDGGTYDPGPRTVTWGLGDLARGATGSRTLTVAVNVPSGHTLDNTCEIAADEAVGRVRSISTQVCGQMPRNADHKLAIHVKPHGTTCDAMPGFTACGDIVTTLNGCGDIDFIPVFFDLNEVTGIEFALTWPAEWGSCAFTACYYDTRAGGITNPGDYVSLGWSTCQRTWSIAPGYGWLAPSGPGLINPLPGGPNHSMGVWNCEQGLGLPWRDSPSVVYRAGVCGEIGDTPSGTMSTKPTTWGAIKAMFK